MREVMREKITHGLIIALRPFRKPIRSLCLKKNSNEIIEIKEKKDRLEKEILSKIKEVKTKQEEFNCGINKLIEFCDVNKNSMNKSKQQTISELSWKIYFNNPDNYEYQFRNYINEYESILSEMYELVCDRRLFLGAQYKSQKENFNYKAYRNRIVNKEIDNMFEETFKDIYIHKKALASIRNDR